MPQEELIKQNSVLTLDVLFSKNLSNWPHGMYAFLIGCFSIVSALYLSAIISARSKKAVGLGHPIYPLLNLKNMNPSYSYLYVSFPQNDRCLNVCVIESDMNIFHCVFLHLQMGCCSVRRYTVMRLRLVL